MSTTYVTAAQAIVDGAWALSDRARAACRARAWPAFVEATSPPPCGTLLGRSDAAACRRLAAERCEGPDEVVVEIIPIWVGYNLDSLAAPFWFAGHATRIGAGALSPALAGPIVDDASPALDVVVRCRARRWRVANVVRTESYARSIPMLVRRGAFGVLAGEVFELLLAQCAQGDPVPRPTVSVPECCAWYEPRVAGLAPEVVAAIRGWSVTVPEIGAQFAAAD